MCLVNGKFIASFQYIADKVMKNLNDVEGLMSLLDLSANLKIKIYLNLSLMT